MFWANIGEMALAKGKLSLKAGTVAGCIPCQWL
jgi:hypothetical protein